MATVIEEPEAWRFERSATDLFRAVVGLLVLLTGVVLAYLLEPFNANLKVALTESFIALPSWITQTLVDGIAVAASLVVVAVIVVALIRRQPRFLLVALVGHLIAVPVIALLSPSKVDLDSATQAALGALDQALDAGGTPSATALSTVALLAGMAVAWLGATWARWLWVLLVAYSSIWVLGTPDSPATVLIAIGAGVSGAAAASYLHGRPNLRPHGAEIAGDFARAGLPLASLCSASVDARGSTPYFGTTSDGREVFIKVLAEDERSSDLMFRAYRYLRFKNLGDLRPFSSLRRAVEHEALVALWAAANGIRTPAVAAVATIGDDGIGLAYERVYGRSLDGIDADDIDQGTLEAAWSLIAQLREHGIAHRDLRLANVLLASDGRPWMIDFGFSELAASDEQLRSDIAEFLASTAVKVGVEPAVAACVRVIGPEAMADAAPRLQPMALSTATRRALGRQKGLGKELQEEVVRVSGIGGIDFERLERIRISSVLTVFSLLLALYLLAPQLAGFSSMWSHVEDLRWSQVVPALVASALTYVGAAVTLMGAVPSRIPFGLTFLAQLAGSFVNRIVPGRVGGLATNVLFLQKQGVGTPSAVAGVGVQQVAGVIVHVTMTAIFAVIVGSGGADEVLKEDVRLILIVVVGVLLLTGLLLVIPWIRRRVVAKLMPPVRRSVEGLRAVAHQPLKLVEVVGGATMLNVFYIEALLLSVRAFDGDASFASVAVAYLAGVAIASAAPTPGGIVAVEAALTVALISIGVDKDIALPSVLLFRVVTFWLPVLPGWVSLLYLQRRDAL